jgi:hypothetical protein
LAFSDRITFGNIQGTDLADDFGAQHDFLFVSEFARRQNGGTNRTCLQRFECYFQLVTAAVSAHKRHRHYRNDDTNNNENFFHETFL